ncbi:hypothetical protein CKN86_08215 [Carnobacterium divergens]|uniref:hypothetical protein n=1 Tax=Carnobacterium divergens TaxID=2748 RepID=UPI000D487C79|nr:hypothetical protein [Carnobacterium divergens]MCO6018007.1 hypothetical protein [Carnobacterium divergens]MPQ21123.1 hypothetical protein [Carnobacterium divergens]TFI61835.1 hypothetical protein CKN62_08355 [Carnobacterium divergens]TFI89107.1 hypothetical protein CKN84_08245 [Carnobacterium divergens]TFJ03260.1 hypothetical protein CKN86_08215 [Carnobacterium divergens]
MNQGNVNELTEAEEKELQSISNLIFVETIACGFYELKKIEITLPHDIPRGRIYTREKIGELLLSNDRFSILIETNDGKYLYQSSTVEIPEVTPHP